ncbi:MAG TPA: hypothetical protein PKL73_11555 [Polyangiaceae bacterium]|nr:hypothetical protein [Polyangiaceae bacterium]HNZ21759.1 hypothetical protein [Polyangiaceae bacterium]HOD25049.1 hypothetical protein [Polyangiaceae bacterium]HOE50780.1 hypothetical protein [Polyangiaceae bacterium]HOG99680.1 hypothetical protein [Polyangiaceae bacterium]
MTLVLLLGAKPVGAQTPKETESAAASSSAAPASSSVPAASAPEATTAGPPDTMDGSTYSIRLRDLEQRIDELKEQIRRSHTRLSLLSDSILGGGSASARADITFDNEMSGAFRLTRAVFVLDGAVQYNRSDDTGALADQKTIPIYQGSIPPGDHTLQVVLELRGHGYGVFSYLRGYKFEVRSSHSFTITDGNALTLRTIAYEKGGVTTPLEQRPAVRFIENVGSLDSRGTPASSPKPAAKATLSIGGK